MQFLVKTLYLKKYLGPHVQYNLCSYVDRQIASLYAYFLHNALFAGIFWRHCKFKNLKTETSTIKSLITSLSFFYFTSWIITHSILKQWKLVIVDSFSFPPTLHNQLMTEFWHFLQQYPNWFSYFESCTIT